MTGMRSSVELSHCLLYEDVPSFVRVSLDAVDGGFTIQITSSIDIAEFAHSFISNESSKLMLELSFDQHQNAWQIKLGHSDEFMACELYDRLLCGIDSIYDNVVADIILADLKELIRNTNPLFVGANISRLLRRSDPLTAELPFAALFDVFTLESWNVGVRTAKHIYRSIDERLNKLVVPAEAIQSLIADFPQRERYVVEHRCLAADMTLEELGAEFGLTRERIRQIVAKTQNKCKASAKKRRLVQAVFDTLEILCASEHCFSIEELNRYGISEAALVFLSELLEGNYTLTRLPETDYMAFCDSDGVCEWFVYVEKTTANLDALLPPIEQQVVLRELSSSLEKMGCTLPDQVLFEIAFRHYDKNGVALIKKPLRRGERYEIVLEQFFPDGIRLYQEKELALFRKGYEEIFADSNISENDHALVSRIAERCVLVDKGTYILNRETELSPQLTQQVFDYILLYPSEMVMTNAILHRFHAELKEAGVDNKYYLLSILKQCFSDQFSFRRDYVIKGDVDGNFYDIVADFVAIHPEGISLHNIQSYFQDTPETVLGFALNENDNIIPMYNKMYTHRDSLIFPEQQQMLDFLKELVEREHIVSDQRLYRLIQSNFSDFIANNNIHSSWFLFSIFRSYFSGKFKFSRPHIIDPAFDSANGREALKSSFWGKRRVEMADIKNYAKEKQIQIYDWSKLMDSYSDQYFILSKEQLIHIDEIGYGSEEFVQVEAAVLQVLGKAAYAEIAKLNVAIALPRANVPLTEWLIYSIINQYGTQLFAATSSSQFMNSVPLVVRNGMDIEAVREDIAASGALLQTVKIDDLSDIDALMEEITDLDFIWEEYD